MPWRLARSLGFGVVHVRVRVLGSLLAVYPAAGLPRVAVENDAPLIIVDREPTPYDDYAERVLHGSAGKTLGGIAAQRGLALAH